MKKNGNKIVKYLVSTAVCATVAFPVFSLPLGMRDTLNPSLLVRTAYAAAFPEPTAEELQALEARQYQYNEADVLGAGVTIQSTYTDDYINARVDNYKDLNADTYLVFQRYDEGGCAIELVDPEFFAPADERLFIAAYGSILKEEPVMDSITLSEIGFGIQVTRIGVGDTWSKIRLDDGLEGYVLTNTLSIERQWVAIDRTVWVDTGSLMLRAEPSTESEILATLYDEDRLHCVAWSDSWYKVITESGLEGYVYQSFTTQTPPPTPTPTPIPVVVTSSGGGGGGGGGGGSYNNYSNVTGITYQNVGNNGQTIANIAVAMVGKPYVWGACSADAVDCSGLVCYAYGQLGVTLPHYSVSLCSVGVAVSRDEAQPGDIVCWHRGDGYCHHVGIYIGGGQCVDATGAAYGVCYHSLDMHPILTIRRIYT
ncbi:MAG: C40 family peptidase [Clostridiales bacterium]|nr:C40 family peptidase [Clostridiales bacterium]